MLDYNSEADRYDATRGGEHRAVAAAKAVAQLLPDGTRTLLDVACGTGIVTRHLLHPARQLVGLDGSPGMLDRASRRLPGRVVLADATHLPIMTASIDAVLTIWLLHLLDDAAPVLAEVARVLRPGGVMITTVDKNEAAFAIPSDVATVTQEVREPHARTATDHRDRVIAQAGEHGLRLIGEASFSGVGQGRSTRHWQQQILAGRIPWFPTPNATHSPSAIPDQPVTLDVPATPDKTTARNQPITPSPFSTVDQPVGHDHVANPIQAGTPTTGADLVRALSALPDQDTPRPDPIYRLIALARSPHRR